jgi:hypothetical protein
MVENVYGRADMIVSRWSDVGHFGIEVFYMGYHGIFI